MHTFIKERPIMLAPGDKGQGLAAKSGKKMGKVTVDDAAMFIGRFKNGALANLEATRFALGRKNHIEIEINGSKGSLFFDFEDMNRLKFFDNTNAADRMGFRDILVTQGGGVHPYVGHWWPPGHIIGYEHTFVHTIADFVNACVNGKSVQPTFEDGLMNQRVLEAVEKSAKNRQWGLVSPGPLDLKALRSDANGEHAEECRPHDHENAATDSRSGTETRQSAGQDHDDQAQAVAGNTANDDRRVPPVRGVNLARAGRRMKGRLRHPSRRGQLFCAVDKKHDRRAGY